jgi:hypothetical protein
VFILKLVMLKAKELVFFAQTILFDKFLNNKIMSPLFPFSMKIFIMFEGILNAQDYLF